jgi:hypothetical protein
MRAELTSVDRDRRPLLSVRRGAIGLDCRSEVIQDGAAVRQVDGLAFPDGKKRVGTEARNAFHIAFCVAAGVLTSSGTSPTRSGGDPGRVKIADPAG